jgi:hypothetical protein
MEGVKMIETGETDLKGEGQAAWQPPTLSAQRRLRNQLDEIEGGLADRANEPEQPARPGRQQPPRESRASC